MLAAVVMFAGVAVPAQAQTYRFSDPFNFHVNLKPHFRSRGRRYRGFQWRRQAGCRHP